MKPIQLTMTAFGPYKEQEVISFDELNGHRLFIISGKTGAGKTTLFDGICFALFGSASGEDRGEPRMMRSQFAPDELHTSVEFTFELRGLRYRLLRQMPHVKQGNKSATGEKYEFFECTDDGEVPCVDRQMVSEINEKVRRLIGLTEDQFKQIVMLPQGEFRKLLTSDTENKEGILRRLFQTEPYQWFSAKMNERRTAVKQELTTVQDRLKQQYSHLQEAVPEREDSPLHRVLQQENRLSSQVSEALGAEAAHYETRAAEARGKAAEKEKEYDRALHAYHDAKQINAQFDSLKEKEAEAEKLQAEAPAVEAKKKELQEAEKAASIRVYDEQRRSAREDEKAKQEAEQRARKTSEAAEARRKTAEAVYEEEAGRQEERETAAQKLHQYEELLPVVAAADEAKQKLNEQAGAIRRQTEEQTARKEQMQSVQKELDQLRADIRTTETETSQLAGKQRTLQEKKETGTLFRKYMNKAEAAGTLEKQAAEKRAAADQEKAVFQRVERAWVQGRAAVLAGHLHDGEACPVCGSTEHPEKAAAGDDVPSEEAYDEARQKLQSVQQEALQVEAELASVRRERDEAAEELPSFSFDSYAEARQQFDVLLEEATALQKDVQRLEQRAGELTQMRERREEKEQTLAGLQTKAEEAAKTLQQLEIDYASGRSEYEAKISRLPEALRTETALQAEIDTWKQTKQELERRWQAAQKEQSEAAQNEAGAAASSKAAAAQRDEAEGRRKQAEEQFENARRSAGFESDAAYSGALLSEAEQERRKQEIDTHASRTAAVQQQTAELRRTLADKEPHDLDAFQAKLEALKEEAAEAKARWTNDEALVTLLENAREKLAATAGEIEAKEKQAAVIEDVYDTVRGQNSKKISFERYVQIEFLENIIAAANERLHRMTAGQFQLVRSDRQESRGKQSGLSLDVYDAYTGQNRDVKTLSGGEKFNASLSMALGMSDVIQSYQGGIQIDTMFIDEGFGSLDEESLHKVMDTLIDLQKSGRLIGVISHVQEMKTVFPAVLNVTKAPDGHSSTRFVVT
ncbi:AAA family ATPase [Alkalicoccus urumqiensis]|uniref:Nuclease SbcCD subunit C n=1 Tax=Alkalicoccus urumqiensis TaxID=1548213 RepID=A0A2P6MDY3_ALKUR|nr:SMC family ATPase [Alkalicoccus urumqiensis]PRO64480.1 exonuclease [Alkalicoccus urumqiensis]